MKKWMIMFLVFITISTGMPVHASQDSGGEEVDDIRSSFESML